MKRGLIHHQDIRAGVVLIALIAALAPLSGARGDDEPAVTSAAGTKVYVNPGEVNLYVPQRWGELRLGLANPHEHPVEFFCVTYFDGEPALQYGRRVWVPPRSRLSTAHPLRVPRVDDPKQQLLELRTLVLDSGRSGETLVSQATGELKIDQSLRIAGRKPVTALLDVVTTDPQPLPGGMSATDFLLTTRWERTLGQNLVYLIDPLLPSREEAFDGIDQLVVADDRLAGDGAGLTMVRRWLYGGGRLWVMLDRVDPRLLEALLGDAFSCQVVDRVGLTSVALESRLSRSDRVLFSEFDRPVDHVRVLANDVEVTHTVNGWPAAFRKSCGQGRLLVTTLGAEAWLLPRPESFRQSRSASLPPTNFLPSGSLDQLAEYILTAKPPSPLPQQAAELHAAEQVGYTVPARSVVVGLLAAFTAAWAGLAAFLFRQGRLEQISVWGPVTAFFAGGVLVFAGHQSRGTVPPTTAALQFVQTIPGTDDVSISGVAGVFTSDAGRAAVSGSHGGWILPDADGMQGTTRRLIWTDANRWQWENLPQSPGLRTVEFHESRAMQSPVRALVTLDEHGVAGRLTLPTGLRATDGLIATPVGRIGVAFAEDGTFRAASDQVLSTEQFVAADVLSDEQHRRSRTLAELLARRAELLARRKGEPHPQQPALLFWTAPFELGLRFQDEARQQGSALVSIPIAFSRPKVGTEIALPPPLLPYDEGYGPDGFAPSGFYDARLGQWLQKHQPSVAWLGFEAPEALLPLDPLTARITIQVTGPVGKLDIAGVKNGALTPIKTWIDPVGTLTLDIADPDLLALTPDGRLTLRIAGGDPDRPELTAHQTGPLEHKSFWQIESLTLELRARVIAASPP